MKADIRGTEIRAIFDAEDILKILKGSLRAEAVLRDQYGSQIGNVPFSVKLLNLEGITFRQASIKSDPNGYTLLIDPRLLESLASKVIHTEYWKGDNYTIGLYHSDVLNNFPETS